jgi:hypothetical protein
MRLSSISFRLRLSVLAALAALMSSVPAVAASLSHCVVGLADFHSESSPSDRFYVAYEGDSNAIFTVKTRFEGDCQEEDLNPWVDYRLDDGTAVSGSDYQDESGRLQLVDGGEFELISLVDDVAVDEAVEYFNVVLTGARSPWVRSPSQGRIYTLDDDGTTPRASFHPLPSFSQSETLGSVQIPVFLAGPIASSVTVDWSVEPVTATADDYVLPGSQTLTFTSGDRVQLIEFTIVDDSVAESSETVQVKLTDGVDYDLGSPNTLTLTIVDNEETIPPVTKFHHPRHELTYPYGDYRLREMHVFGKDDGGAGIVQIQMALRKKKTDGSCTWWDAGTSKWAAGPCTEKRWMNMTDEGPWSPTWPYFYSQDFPPLRPSVGTPIKYYTAWCRGIDGAGNVETIFVRDRTSTRVKGDGNWSTFEVARR